MFICLLNIFILPEKFKNFVNFLEKFWGMQTRVHKNETRYRQIACWRVFCSACSNPGTKNSERSAVWKLAPEHRLLVPIRNVPDRAWNSVSGTKPCPKLSNLSFFIQNSHLKWPLQLNCLTDHGKLYKKTYLTQKNSKYYKLNRLRCAKISNRNLFRMASVT